MVPGERLVDLDVAAAIAARAASAMDQAPSPQASEALAVSVIERSAELVEAWAPHRVAEVMRHLENAKRAIAQALFANDRLRRKMEVRVGVAAIRALLVYDERFEQLVEVEGYLVGAADELLETARESLYGRRLRDPAASAAQRRLMDFEAALDRIDDLWSLTERQIENGYEELTESMSAPQKDECALVAAQLIVGSEQLATGWEIAVAERRPLAFLQGLRALANEHATDATIYAADEAVSELAGTRDEWCVLLEAVMRRELPAANVLTRPLIDDRRVAVGLGDYAQSVITTRMCEAAVVPAPRMRSLALIGALMLLPTASSGCLVTPSNGEVHANRLAPVAFTGYAQAPNATVQIHAAPTASGPFTSIATTQAVSAPSEFWGGAVLYAFEEDVFVPFGLWRDAGCFEDEVFVRAYGNGTALPTYDHPSIAAEHPGACFLREEAAGTSFYDALFICASPDSPVARIITPANNTTTHVGDVVIDDAADLAALGCVSTIDGDLTIAGPFALDVALEALATVTGDLHIEYPRDASGHARAADLPRLATVGGSVTLVSPAAVNTNTAIVAFGLDALAAIGGDLLITVDGAGVDWSGLGALGTIPGALVIDGVDGDTDPGVLANLTSVAGDATIDLHTTVRAGFLARLESVGGSLDIVGGHFVPGTFADLTAVGGDFIVRADVQLIHPNQRVYPSLTHVGGRLELEHVAANGALDFGAHLASVGAFTLHDAGVTTLGVTSIRVRGAGAIVITDNAALCTSEAQAFVASQSRWFGTATIRGNDKC